MRTDTIVVGPYLTCEKGGERGGGGGKGRYAPLSASLHRTDTLQVLLIDTTQSLVASKDTGTKRCCCVVCQVAGVRI